MLLSLIAGAADSGSGLTGLPFVHPWVSRRGCTRGARSFLASPLYRVSRPVGWGTNGCGSPPVWSSSLEASPAQAVVKFVAPIMILSQSGALAAARFRAAAQAGPSGKAGTARGNAIILDRPAWPLGLARRVTSPFSSYSLLPSWSQSATFIA